MTERRDPGGQATMKVVEAVEGTLRRVLPTAGLRLAYRAGYLALQPYWLVTSPKVVGTKVVVLHDDHVLLLRHSYARRGIWDLPGGFVHPGERAADTVDRELREELDTEPLTVRCICRNSAVNDHKRETLLTFVATVASGEITPSPAEIDRAEWFPVGELPEAASPFVRRMVARSQWPEPMFDELRTR